MSTSAANRANDVLRHAARVVAIELVCSVRGIEHRQRASSSALGAGTAPAFTLLSPLLARSGSEATPSDDIAAALSLIEGGQLLAAVEAAVGELPRVHHG